MAHPRRGQLGLPVDPVVRRGSATPALEGFTGCAARVGARIAVPVAAFLGRVLAAVRSRTGVPVPITVNGAARYLTAGDARRAVPGAVAVLTGHPRFCRLSHLAFSDLFGVAERTMPAVTRGWCPACWRAAAAEP